MRDKIIADKKEIYRLIRSELLAMAEDEPLGACYESHKKEVRRLEKMYAKLNLHQGVPKPNSRG